MNRTWVKLGETAKSAIPSVTLAEAVTGWKAGDRIFVTATSHMTRQGTSTEERIIKAIDGTKLTLDQPLETSISATDDYRGEVANLSRNVVVESADPKGVAATRCITSTPPARSATPSSAISARKACSAAIACTTTCVGDTMRGSSVVGSSIWDSDNRWLTIHGTNYLVVRDNVGYRASATAISWKTAPKSTTSSTATWPSAPRRASRCPSRCCRSTRTKGPASGGPTASTPSRATSPCECDSYGFRFEATPRSGFELDLPVLQPDGSAKAVDIRTLPFVRFEDNEVHSSHGLYGVNLGEGVNRVGPDAQASVHRPQHEDLGHPLRLPAASAVAAGGKPEIHRAHYGVYHPNYDNHVYRNVLISGTNTEPFNRGHDDLSMQYGPLAVDGLTFDNCRSGGMPLIQISDDNPTGKAVSHFRNVKTTNWEDSSKERAI